MSASVVARPNEHNLLNLRAFWLNFLLKLGAYPISRRNSSRELRASSHSVLE
jgi:hypothetical protein